MHVELEITTQLWQLMQIPRHFKDEMERTKLHSSQLVNVELSIYPFFLNMKTETSSGSHVKAESKKNKTIAQDYRRCPSCQSTWGKRQWAAKPGLCCWQRPSAQEETDRLSELHVAKIVLTASNHDAQHLWVGSRWIPSLKRDRANRTKWKQFFVGSV